MTTKFALRYNTGLAEPSIEPTQIVLDGRLIWKAGAASPARYDASANNPPALTFHPDRLIFTTVSVADLCVVLGTNENCSVIVRIDPVNLTSLSALSALLHPGQSNIFTLVAPEDRARMRCTGRFTWNGSIGNPIRAVSSVVASSPSPIAHRYKPIRRPSINALPGNQPACQ
ncbi:unnamed protein product, partial [Mesorhabditis spiculigera]